MVRRSGEVPETLILYVVRGQRPALGLDRLNMSNDLQKKIVVTNIPLSQLTRGNECAI